MDKTTPAFLLTTLLTGLLLLPSASMASIKCWTNKEGIRECGNAIPPEYAQQETRTLDRRGRTIEVRPRAQTAEEVEAERRREQEAERQRAEEEERRRQQAAYDRSLLASYLSEEDILRTRERMTGAINASIELSRINIETLQERLEKEREQAARQERQGREVPQGTLDNIESLEKQIADREQYIARQELEREQLHQRYEAERLRFLELKGR